MQTWSSTLGYGFEIDRREALKSLDPNSYLYNIIDDEDLMMKPYSKLVLEYSGDMLSDASDTSERAVKEYVFLKDSVVKLDGWNLDVDIDALVDGSMDDEAIAELFFMLGNTGVGVGALKWHMIIKLSG